MPSEITSLSAFFISISSLSTFPSVEVFFGKVPPLDALINPDFCSIRRRRREEEEGGGGGGGGGGGRRGEEEEEEGGEGRRRRRRKEEEEEEEEKEGGGGGGEEKEEEEDNINEQLSLVSNILIYSLTQYQ